MAKGPRQVMLEETQELGRRQHSSQQPRSGNSPSARRRMNGYAMCPLYLVE